MKYYLLTLTGLVSAFALNFSEGMPVSAQRTAWSSETTQHPITKRVRFECLKDDDKFITIAHTSRGSIDMVTWQSHYFGPQWTPERRCDVVTQRFQEFSDSHQLKFVSQGRINNYKVLCVSEQSGRCLDGALLITLERRDNPVRVLSNLFDYQTMVVRGRKTVISIDEILQTRQPRPGLSISPLNNPSNPLSLDRQLNNNVFEVAPVWRGY